MPQVPVPRTVIATPDKSQAMVQGILADGSPYSGYVQILRPDGLPRNVAGVCFRTHYGFNTEDGSGFVPLDPDAAIEMGATLVAERAERMREGILAGR